MLQNYLNKNVVEAGCDEAGRGCLAGPVFAAAVIMPSDYRNSELNDSKLLSEKMRNKLRKDIEKHAIDFAVGSVDNITIDKINILKASVMGMHKALDKLKIRPGHIIIDGNWFIPYPGIPHTCIVKGDRKYNSIAAASVLAKTYRDEFMLELHGLYDIYGWDKNKGYPTKYHRQAIYKYGPSKYHRNSFQLLDPQMELNFNAIST